VQLVCGGERSLGEEGSSTAKAGLCVVIAWSPHIIPGSYYRKPAIPVECTKEMRCHRHAAERATKKDA
jgi:hypothetical protein